MTKPQILIVEDEIIIAMDMQNSLKKKGYNAEAIAATGEDAIKKTEELHPDLVLMDIKLKGEVDGIEAAREIRERLKIPVAFITAYADESTIKRARETQPIGILLKPFRERELQSFVEMMLDKSRMEKG
jgi:CheY-like chemotaxis protein